MSIGMMDGAYFVGRVELLNWLNDLLQLDYTKIEQACSGCAVCQIFDAIYPGKVPLKKVNFNAKQEYEYIANFKVLQKVFDELRIDKRVDIDKLVKGKYQDNLEFLQWVKSYYDKHSSGEPYNAVERRNSVLGTSSTKAKSASTSSGSSIKKNAPVITNSTPITITKEGTRPTSKNNSTSIETKTSSTSPSNVVRKTPSPKNPPEKSPTPKSTTPVKDSSTPKATTPAKDLAPKTTPAKDSAPKTTTPAKDSAPKTTTPAKDSAPKATTVSKDSSDKTPVQNVPSNEDDHKTPNANLKLAIEGLEKERDFYFSKLRDIELYCQAQQDQENEIIQTILKILYATDESEEFTTEESQK